eukprot:3545597-Rhodomonas_salina.1
MGSFPGPSQLLLDRFNARSLAAIKNRGARGRARNVPPVFHPFLPPPPPPPTSFSLCVTHLPP